MYSIRLLLDGYLVGKEASHPSLRVLHVFGKSVLLFLFGDVFSFSPSIYDGTLNSLLCKVCFVVCDNGFSQIFYNCSNVEEIFSWHNIASSLLQNVQQKF